MIAFYFITLFYFFNGKVCSIALNYITILTIKFIYITKKKYVENIQNGGFSTVQS